MATADTSVPTVTVHIPTPLRSMTDGAETVDVQGTTVRDAVDHLTEQHGELRKHLFTDEGSLRNFVNIYLDDEDIRYLEKEQTPLEEGQSLSIVPSIAGGR